MNRTEKPMLLLNYTLRYLCVPSSFAVKDKQLTKEFESLFARLNRSPQHTLYVCPMTYISMSPYVADNFDFSYTNWETACWKIMQGCDQVVVLKVEGWNTSKGVLSEINAASVLNKPVIFIDYPLTQP